MTKLRQLHPVTLVAIFLLVLSIFIAVDGYFTIHSTVDLLAIVTDFYANISAELGSIAVTVIIIDQLNRRRDREERKLALFRQAKSRSNDFAVDALDQIQQEDWWEELLEHYPSANKNYRIDLSRVQWAGGVMLREANLQQALLLQANLQEAFLEGAILEKADLWSANLQQTKLTGANLQQTLLRNANLHGANLARVNLAGAEIHESTKFDNRTVLPDANIIGSDQDGTPLYDKYWTPETKMKRYTDPDHPDFWQPPEKDE